MVPSGSKSPAKEPWKYHDDNAEDFGMQARYLWSDQCNEDLVLDTSSQRRMKMQHLHDQDDEDSSLSNTYVAQLCREGGVELANYLLYQAIPPDGSENLPGPSVNHREWTYKDIQRLPTAEQTDWIKACKDELEALSKRKVYNLVDRPKDSNVIKCRWVFAVKSDGRKKARLVAKGFTQVEGEDFSEVFSPVVRFETARFMIALAAIKHWHISSLDVKSAFLYGELDEELYMEQPEGFKLPGQERKVCRLNKAIYGLKQAAITWWKALDKSMAELGFRRCKSDAGVFVYTHGTDLVVVLVYVDDSLFFGQNKALVERLKKRFMEKWESRDLGDAKEFLGINIKRVGAKIFLDQREYLEKVLVRCNMQNGKSAPTPLPEGYFARQNLGDCNAQLRQRYQQVIGSLLYLMLGTRPDISFAVTLLSRHASNPTQEHLNKAYYICRYLCGTRQYSLVYNGHPGVGFEAHVDSDWGSNLDTRRSTSGYILSLANGIFTWTSRTQKSVATSSTEAEYMALSDCSRQVVWIRQLLGELGFHPHPTPVSGDNQGSIFIAQNPVTERRSKHIDIRYHYIREQVVEDKIVLQFVPGVDNPADMFTKNLGKIKFDKCRKMLGLQFDSAGTKVIPLKPPHRPIP